MDQRLAEIEGLIARVALRDRSAFSVLYDRTSAKLFGICLRVLGDRAEAEDAVRSGIAKAGETVKNIEGAWVKDTKTVVREGAVTEWRVTLVITFIVG